MDLAALRTFIAVIDNGGILAASRQLNTVQSNVTSRIKRLEEELQTSLFYRQGRGLTLAPSGQVLEDYARRMLQLEYQAGQAVRQAGNQSGELRIGTMESFAALRLSPVLQQLRSEHPLVRLQVSTNTSAALVEQILSHQLDCAFIGGPLEHPEIIVSQAVTEELTLVRHADTDPACAPLILFREGCEYRNRAISWQRQMGYGVNQIMEMGSLDGILSCTAAGLGYTLMPRAVISASSQAGYLLCEQLPGELAEAPTLLIRHRDTQPMAALNTLAAHFREDQAGLREQPHS